jgi:hypothetical protein
MATLIAGARLVVPLHILHSEDRLIFLSSVALSIAGFDLDGRRNNCGSQ